MQSRMCAGRTRVRAAGLVLLAALGLWGQANITPRPQAPPNKTEATPPLPSLRVETSLVMIPVSVSDPLNRPVTGLEQENFRVYDDKIEQKIRAFAMEDEPVAVGLVFDTSGSMGDKLGRSRMAARAFFQTSNPEDEFFLVEFDNSPRLVVPLTKETGTIENQLVFTKSKGSTALLDAIMLAMHEMRKSKKNKKALLVISDGGDNNSRYSPTEIKNLLAESDCLVYAIGIFGGGSTAEEADGPRLLSRIAEETGGRLFPATPAEMPDIAHAIGVDLRNRYILGFTPTNQQHDGKYHRVNVVVVPPRGLPPLRAHWRTGYYAPVQ